jgi:hypothetical protein
MSTSSARKAPAQSPEELHKARYLAVCETIGCNPGGYGSSLDYFGKIVLPDPEEDDLDRTRIPTAHLNTHALESLVYYRFGGMERPPHGEDLMSQFLTDFWMWTTKTFSRLDKNLRIEIRRVLRERGVYTGEKQGRADQQLAKLANTEDESFPVWPDDVPREADEAYMEVLTRKDPVLAQQIAAQQLAAQQQLAEQQLAKQRLAEQQRLVAREQDAQKATVNPPPAPEQQEQQQVRQDFRGQEVQQGLGEQGLGGQGEGGREPPLGNPPPPPPPPILAGLPPQLKREYPEGAIRRKRVESHSGKSYDVLDVKVRRFLGLCRLLKVSTEGFRPGSSSGIG